MQNYPVDKRLLVILAIVIIGSYFVLLAGATVVDSLIREDGLIENVGTLGFLVASICFFIAFWRARQSPERYSLLKQLAFLGLAGLFFFIVGEEISWGQRIFDFATPEGLKEVNTQDEFNFHNLEAIQNNSFLNTDRLFALFWIGYMLLLPLTAVFHKPFGNWVNQWLPVMPLLFGLLFLLNYVVANIVRPAFSLTDLYQSAYPLPHSVVELKEALYGILYGIVGVYVVRLMKSEMPSFPKEGISLPERRSASRRS